MRLRAESVLLGSDEAAFAIQSAGPLRSTSSEWDNDALAVLESDSLDQGLVIVRTGSQHGPFEVRVEEHDGPCDLTAEWEDVVELSLEADGPLRVTELVDQDPVAVLVGRGGESRIRICARGRRVGVSTEDLLEDAEWDEDQAVEFYLVQAWPAPLSDPVVLRMTSDRAHELIAGIASKDLSHPGRAAGLRAAARIGRDAQSAAQARVLSGDLGSAVVETEIAATSRRLYALFAFSMTLTPSDQGGWIYSGGVADYDLNVPAYGSTLEDHPDQLPGTLGTIRTSFVEVRRPRLLVKRWNWMRKQVGSQRGLGQPVLEHDSIVTITLAGTAAANGSEGTRVRVEHTGLPVEWVDDMRTWWTYQLQVTGLWGF